MKTIYVVQGSTGEYSDHEEWMVKAFTSEIAAQRLVIEAQARANELWAECQLLSEGATHFAHPEPGANEFDSKMRHNYFVRNRYECIAVELEDDDRPSLSITLGMKQIAS